MDLHPILVLVSVVVVVVFLEWAAEWVVEFVVERQDLQLVLPAVVVQLVPKLPKLSWNPLRSLSFHRVLLLFSAHPLHPTVETHCHRLKLS